MPALSLALDPLLFLLPSTGPPFKWGYLGQGKVQGAFACMHGVNQKRTQAIRAGGWLLYLLPCAQWWLITLPAALCSVVVYHSTNCLVLSGGWSLYPLPCAQWWLVTLTRCLVLSAPPPTLHPCTPALRHTCTSTTPTHNPAAYVS